MINPQSDLKSEDRVSLPVGLVQQAYSILSELPAHRVMDVLNGIRDDAEVVTLPALTGAVNGAVSASNAGGCCGGTADGSADGGVEA